MIGYHIEATSQRFRPSNPEDLRDYLRMFGAEVTEGPTIKNGRAYVKVDAYSNQARVIVKYHLEDLGFNNMTVTEFEWEE